MKITDKVICPNLELKNRLIMPPMATAKAGSNGEVTEEILKYYDEKTSHGLFAAVIVEHNYVDPLGMAHKNQMSVSKDSDIEGLKKLSSIIKKNGSKAILQISHAGSMAKKEVTGHQCLAPSPVKSPTGNNPQIPHELTKAEIEKLKKQFIDAAIRVKEAGFDGVEIHSAHGYLLNQFLSPLSNKREDEYGKDIYGRIKIHLDIIRGIREELRDYPVFIRMGAGDFMEGGLSTEDAIIAAGEFEKAGVDLIDVSGGMCFYTIKDTRPGYFDTISKPVFDNVNIPVMLTGGVKKGQDVNDILSRNVCNLVGIGRSVFNDSSWMEREIGTII